MAKKDQPTVWVSCRAKAGCDGKEARLVFKRKLGSGGKTIRYRCLKCNGAFHITL